MALTTRVVWGGVGAAVFVLAFLPIPTWTRAAEPGPLWNLYVDAWLIGVVVVVGLAVIGGRLGTRWRPTASWPRRSPTVGLAALTAASLALGLLVMFAVFAGNPHLVDEFAQLFHARVFASGALAATPPPQPRATLFLHTFITDAGWVSQFPPGHTALLALGMLAHAEWLVNPVIAAAGVPLMYVVGRGLYGPKTGLLAAAVWTICPWVVFMAGTYTSHVSATILILAAWAAVVGPRSPSPRWFLLGGAALAAAATARPLDAVAGSLGIIVWMQVRHRWRGLPWMVVGGVPIIAALSFVHWRLYGHPLTFGYTAAYGSEHGLGFHVDPWGRAFTPLVALGNLAASVRRLHIYFFEWPIPALLPLGIWALAARRHRRADLVLAAGVIGGPLLYSAYWHSGFYLGPRFYFCIAPFLVLATVRAWSWSDRAIQTLPTVWIHPRSALRTAALVTVVWGSLSAVSRAKVYRTDLPAFKAHPERELAARGVERAIVLVPEGWSSRVVTRLWERGLPLGLVERAAQQLDTCVLHLIATGDAPRAEMVHDVESRLAARSAPAPRAAALPDPTVRLDSPDSLPAACQREIQRDVRGFTAYANLGWRNHPAYDRGVIFLRDLHEDNDILLEPYVGWPVWRYAPAPDDPDGLPQLRPVREGSL